MGLAEATLPGCTPSATTEMDWRIANHTADTLVVTTRYSLDSLVLTQEEVERWAGSTATTAASGSNSPSGRGYCRGPRSSGDLPYRVPRPGIPSRRATGGSKGRARPGPA